VLEGDLDRERLLVTAPDVSKGKEQQFDLTDRSGEELLGVGEIKCLITFDNTRILAGTEVGHRVAETIENGFLEGGSVIGAADEIRNVGVESSRGDVGEEGRRLSESNVIGGTLRQHRSQGIRGSGEGNGRTLKAIVNTRASSVVAALTI